MTIVHALYGPVEPASTWEDDALARFVPENEGDRLYVGPVATTGMNEYTFGVTRRMVK